MTSEVPWQNGWYVQPDNPLSVLHVQGDKVVHEKLAEIGRENENLTDEVDHSKNHLNKLVDLLEQKLDDLANKAKDVKEEVDELSSSNGKSIKDLKHEINELFDRLADDEKDIKDLNDKVQDSVKVEIETLVSQVQDKLEDVDNKCHENEGHVTNLREVNRIALERIKENVQDDIESHKELIDMEGVYHNLWNSSS